MTSETPGSGIPGWGQQPGPGDQPPGSGEWPKELVPPEQAPPAAAPAPGTWGQPAAPAEPEAAANPPAAAPAPGAWGQPAAPAAAPTPESPTEPVAPIAAPAPAATPAPAPLAPAPTQPPVAQPAWGAPPQPQQPVQPQQPQAPGYGASVPPAATGGQWGAPPPQQPGAWAPPPGAAGGPGAPGGPPVGWQPAPAKSSNGCLKACLIVGIILVVLAVVFFIAITILGMKFASDMGVNPDGSVAQCEFVSNAELAQALGGEPVGMPLGGFVDATIGQLLDKRLLADAADCWLVDESGSSGGFTGRMAFQGGGSFDSELAAAQAGAFFATDIPGFGDQAFCTGIAETGSTGALVRQGGSLAYVSLIAGSVDGFDFSEAPNGVMYSPATCEQAAAIAVQVLR